MASREDIPRPLWPLCCDQPETLTQGDYPRVDFAGNQRGTSSSKHYKIQLMSLSACLAHDGERAGGMVCPSLTASHFLVLLHCCTVDGDGSGVICLRISVQPRGFLQPRGRTYCVPAFWFQDYSGKANTTRKRETALKKMKHFVFWSCLKQKRSRKVNELDLNEAFFFLSVYNTEQPQKAIKLQSK